ncbi:MAG: methionine--tRNA ligase [Chlamydiia bacterium]|nr:methionine--tRNA ligase [Chlamydiia bacterium]
MKESVLITSALPYANGALHFGHIAGAYLPGDCYARFERLMGREVLYICGSDEYGVAITLSAEMAGRTPKQQVDLFHAINRALFEKLQFSFDHYSRTTWPGHVDTVQEFFIALQSKGLIEKKTKEHLYSETERRFLADRYVIGTCPKCGYEEARGDECQRCASSYEATDLKNPRSKVTGSSLIRKPSEHLYLRFDRFKEQLTEWLTKKNWKENVLHFAMRYVNELKPRAITRDLEWGVPVPGYPHKVFYVWFDAPIGYISATKEWAQKMGQPDLWKQYWLNPKTKLIQFIGKDNIPFHAVFFPAMLMGQEAPYKLPDEIPANEFLLLEGKQFSKSDGWTIDLEDFFAKYTADQARYALAANAPESADSEFSWKDFQMRCNAELLGKFGNFIHRTLVFAKTHCASVIPPLGDLHEVDLKFLEQVKLLTDEMSQAFGAFHLRKACQRLMELAAAGNVYFDTKKPWKFSSDSALRSSLETTVACSIFCIIRLALAASPLMPDSAEKVWRLLGFRSTLSKQNWQKICSMPMPVGQRLTEPEILFRKIEDAEIEQEIAKLGVLVQSATHKTTPSPTPSAYIPLKPLVQFSQIEALDLRVAQVLEAIKIPKSKKLLKLLVDLGFETRTIVSGIALSYEPEQLIGKKIVVIANLAPATIMGVESKGMVFAASSGTQLELPLIQHLLPGSVIA